MFDVADFKLTELLSSAGATIGVIIAGTIFLQFLSSKYTELMNRYRELTKEYRGSKGGDNRHGPLQLQIRIYRRRLWLLNRGSWLAALAVIGFLVSILMGGLSLAYPQAIAFKVIGSAGLAAGILLINGGVLLELLESILARYEIGTEVADLDDDAKNKAM